MALHTDAPRGIAAVFFDNRYADVCLSYMSAFYGCLLCLPCIVFCDNRYADVRCCRAPRWPRDTSVALTALSCETPLLHSLRCRVRHWSRSRVAGEGGTASDDVAAGGYLCISAPAIDRHGRPTPPFPPPSPPPALSRSRALSRLLSLCLLLSPSLSLSLPLSLPVPLSIKFASTKTSSTYRQFSRIPSADINRTR